MFEYVKLPAIALSTISSALDCIPLSHKNMYMENPLSHTALSEAFGSVRVLSHPS